jgi:hypothetical protein
MGFSLYCLFAVDSEVLPLYERLISGGSQWAIPTSGGELPAGWVLPRPWELMATLNDEVRLAEQWADPNTLSAWRPAAGVPEQPDPLGAFDDSDLQVASLLSLAAPAGVVYIDDQTAGGIVGNEYAAVFVAGRMRAAYGIDFGNDRRAFELRDGRYQIADPAAVNPVSDCAAILDQRFNGARLFNGYLPRDAEPDSAPRQSVTGPVSLDARAATGWASYFPILAQ